MNKLRVSSFLLLSSFILVLFSCTDTRKSLNPQPPIKSTNLEFWNDGKAEVSSYKLSQARYGEIHEGNAVLVYVTEPFSTKSWTKADNFSPDNKEVLKLNFTKKFNTGVYPYSMMTSSFFPLKAGKSSLKIACSSQEWCGHTYMEMKNKSDYNLQIHSYFQTEAQEPFTIQKNYLEDDFWTILRLNPEELPLGETKVIPSFFYLRLMHKDAKAYTCSITKVKKSDSEMTYSLFYPELKRTVLIHYESTFPHRIVSWEETYTSGWGAKAKTLSTTATLIKTIRTDYWNKHSNKDSGLRKDLGLDN